MEENMCGKQRKYSKLTAKSFYALILCKQQLYTLAVLVVYGPRFQTTSFGLGLTVSIVVSLLCKNCP